MNLIEKFEAWGERHHPKWLDIIRIALGLFLFWKGIMFLQNTSQLTAVMKLRSPFDDFVTILIGHYVTFAHLLGGIFLAIGMFTRAACLIQIPILLGAIIFVNIYPDQLRTYNELFISIIVLFLLIYFLIAGNGPLSIKFPAEEKKRSERFGNKPASSTKSE